jgi:hypothetical protein
MRMIAEMREARHAEERGAILTTLKAAYGSEMTSTRTLWRVLNGARVPVSEEGLQFSLTYLADQGYIKVWRVRDTPGWRPDRPGPRADVIVFARLLPRGLLLVDGQAEADPKVSF